MTSDAYCGVVDRKSERCEAGTADCKGYADGEARSFLGVGIETVIKSKFYK